MGGDVMSSAFDAIQALGTGRLDGVESGAHDIATHEGIEAQVGDIAGEPACLEQR